jgi:hypothetical protein
MEANPVPVMEGVAGSRMRYQVDPLWAQYYLSHSSGSLVFVPEGCTLYPPMHDWEMENPDDYLRNIMGHWFHGKHGVPDIPQKPIYIFDGEARPGRKISISVLDREAFVPLKQKLGWINDNLMVLESYPVEEIISGLATLAGRKQLLSGAEVGSEEMIAQSRNAIESASSEIAGMLQGLVEGYNEEMPDFIQFVRDTNDAITDQKEQLNNLDSQRSDMEHFLTETEQSMGGINEVIEEVNAEIAQLRFQVGESLRDSDKVLAEMESKVAKKLTMLHTSKLALLDQLKNAHRIFSK